MATQNLLVKSGNRNVVQFDGKDVGLVQSVDMRDDYAPEPASGIGDIHVKEYVPTMARHTISVEQMVLHKQSLLKAGISLENGDAALKGMVFDILSIDNETGDVRKYISCSYASGSYTVRKHAIVMATGMFNALDVSGKF